MVHSCIHSYSTSLRFCDMYFHFILSLRILSYTLPTLLASVIPRSLLQFPFIPLPLYSLLIPPSSQLSGIFSLLCISFIILQNKFLVYGSASMKISCPVLGSFSFVVFNYSVHFLDYYWFIFRSWICILLLSVFHGYCYHPCRLLIFLGSWSCLA